MITKVKGIDKFKILAYVWKNHEKYHDSFSAVGVSNFVIDFSGEDISELNGNYIFKSIEVNADGRDLSGDGMIFEKLSQWYIYQNRFKDLAVKVDFVIVADVDTTTALNSRNVLFIKVDLPEEVVFNMVACNTSDSNICIEYVTNMGDMHRVNLLDSLSFDRINYKYKYIMSIYSRCNDWNTLFTYLIFDTIAIATNNRDNFRKLAERVYVDAIISDLNSQQEVEALLFGVSGLLMSEYSDDEYTLNLKSIYQNIRVKYRLVEMERNDWFFNYKGPGMTLHLVMARLAALLHAKINFINILSSEFEVINIYKVMRREVSPYWLRRSQFSANASQLDSSRILADKHIDKMIINAILPLIHAIHHTSGDEDIVPKITTVLYKLKSEKNHIVDKWSAKGLKFKSAFDSQAVIHLDKNYCKLNECGNCILFSRMTR